MSILDNLPDRCNLVRFKYQDADDLGVSVPTRENTSTNVECWVQQAGHNEVLRYQKRGIDFTQKIFFTSDPGIGEDMVLVITSRNGVSIPSSQQVDWDIVHYPKPDASAGSGIVFKVLVNTDT